MQKVALALEVLSASTRRRHNLQEWTNYLIGVVIYFDGILLQKGDLALYIGITLKILSF